MTSRSPGLGWTLSCLLIASSIVGGACGSDGGGTPGTGGQGSGGSGTSTGGAGTGGAGTGGAATGGLGSGTGGANVGTGGAGTGGAATGGAVGGGGAGTGGGSGAAGGGGSATGGAGGGSGMFTVTTPAFVNQPGCADNMRASCANFPRENTNPSNISPAMTWMGAPAGTQSFAVVLQDLTNMNAHWILWNIPATVTSLPANVSRTSAMPPVPAGSQQTSRADGAMGDGYFGPGSCGNVYEFLVYALSVPSFTPTMPTDYTMVRAQLRALGNSILGTASMRARGYAGTCPP